MSQERNAEQTARELIAEFKRALEWFTRPNELEMVAEICAVLCVKKILKANPTHIDCNSSELDYAYWMQVRESIIKKNEAKY